MALFGKSESKKISELEMALDTSNSRVSELEAECADYQKTIASFHLATSTYDKKIEAMKKQHEAELKKVVEQAAETELSVNKRVNQYLQSVGVSTFVTEIPVQTVNPQDVYQTFLAMPPGSVKQEYYQKHEKEIRAASGLQK